MRPGCP
ncbi:hypothetical protein N7491_005524 [Penicillium cf. griseofulvum]|nr:hypothetical protein N7491_005524 [Penicillium cf. griseofulvum]KAJ5452762.1 hypothetical protein N7445_000945 [Penicillium cf. griseofulvum]